MLAELRRRFPNAVMWWGEFTGSYWILARTDAGDRLLEAPTAEQFARHLIRLHAPEQATAPQAMPGDLLAQLAIAATTPIRITRPRAGRGRKLLAFLLRRDAPRSPAPCCGACHLTHTPASPNR
ncbi:hypothetical protein ACQEU3_43045 [Spirillospora sp. CA-253888]